MTSLNLIHTLNCGLWLANACVWSFYAHSTAMGLVSLLAAAGSFVAARWA